MLISHKNSVVSAKDSLLEMPKDKPILVTHKFLKPCGERRAAFIDDSVLKKSKSIWNTQDYLNFSSYMGVTAENTHIYMKSTLENFLIRSLMREEFNVFWIPERQDIIWINFDPQVGREMKGCHTCLVLSSRISNYMEGTVLGIPMSTAEYNADNRYAIAVGKAANSMTSYLVCNKLGTYDWQQRSENRPPLKRLEDKYFAQVTEKVGYTALFDGLNDENSNDIQDRMKKDMINKADSFDVALVVASDRNFCSSVVQKLRSRGKRIVFVDLESFFYRDKAS